MNGSEQDVLEAIQGLLDTARAVVPEGSAGPMTIRDIRKVVKVEAEHQDTPTLWLIVGMLDGWLLRHEGSNDG